MGKGCHWIRPVRNGGHGRIACSVYIHYLCAVGGHIVIGSTREVGSLIKGIGHGSPFRKGSRSDGVHHRCTGIHHKGNRDVHLVDVAVILERHANSHSVVGCPTEGVQGNANHFNIRINLVCTNGWCGSTGITINVVGNTQIGSCSIQRNVIYVQVAQGIKHRIQLKGVRTPPS